MPQGPSPAATVVRTRRAFASAPPGFSGWVSSVHANRRSGRLALDLLLVVLGDVVVDPIRKLEVLIDIGRVRIFRVRHDWEVLVALPFQDPLPRRRAVVVIL